jgi:hypothetical protein
MTTRSGRKSRRRKIQPMPPLNLLGTYADPENLDEGAGKLVNVRVVPREQAKEGKPAPVRFVGAPGLPQVCKPTSAPCIAICHALNTIWSGHADGSIYYGVNTAAPTFAGTVLVNPFQPVIRFAEDRTALAIASNANAINPLQFGTGYTATQGAGVVNAGFDASINFDPSAVAELDNQTLWSAASNFYANQDAKVYRSQPLQPANVQPNSFGTKEARADRVVDLAISGRVLWPLGSRSLEQWYNSGANTDMPFVPYPNSLISVGIAARLSLAVLRDLIVFVATDRRIWLCAGQSGKPISPAWVDLLLQQLTAANSRRLPPTRTGRAAAISTCSRCRRVVAGAVRRLPGCGRIASHQADGWTTPGAARRSTTAALRTSGSTPARFARSTSTAHSEPAGTLSRTMITPWVGGAPAKNMLTSGTGQEETRSVVDAIDVTSSMGPQAGTFELDWSETNDVTVNGVLVASRVWRGLREIVLPQPGTRRAIGRNFGSSRRRQFRLRYGGTQAPFTIDELFAQVTGGS